MAGERSNRAARGSPTCNKQREMLSAGVGLTGFGARACTDIQRSGIVPEFTVAAVAPS
jgi:hypothetical protein